MEKSNFKILIIGQGISGTMLSWHLYKAGIDFILINENIDHTSSKTAAGIINPVTGRRVVTVWMDDILLPFAEKTYNEIGEALHINSISKTDIIDFFPNPFMKESFEKKMNQAASYITLIDDNDYLSDFFNYEFGIGKISPAYIVHLQTLLSAWRNFLHQENKLLEVQFNFSELKVKKDHIVYNDIVVDKIIFCDGTCCNVNPFFSLLPFAINKGEALLIEAPGLPHTSIYKKSCTLVPLEKDDLFWVGTNYIWNFDDDKPTKTFRNSMEQNLKSWLKKPFTIVDHKAAIRPATVERRPFVGFHPIYNNVGILNGMGTKGCSLAPYFAHQLVEHILHGSSILPEADINRHARILSRTIL